jgi:hypothetical protein
MEKVTAPLVSVVVPETGVMDGVPGPEVWLKLTVLFGTPLLVASLKVTVIIEAEVLSAGT